MKKLLTIIAVAAAVSGCFRNELWEKTAKVSSDRTEIRVRAKGTKALPLVDTLLVTANRSWTADVISADAGETVPDWVTLILAEGKNVSGCSEVYPLIVEFKDNELYRQRCAEICIHSNKGMISIPVTQEKADD